MLGCVPDYAAAQAEPKRPEFSPNAQEDDWTFLRDRTKRTDPLDRLKFIEIDDATGSFAYLGGTVRAIERAYDNENWGDRLGFDDVYHRRVMIHGGLVIADRVRFFGELKHGGVTGSRYPQPAVETDDLDLNQAFVELRVGSGNLVRVGRQELRYGKGLLISVREGPNIRQSHYAALVRLMSGRWRVDFLIAAPVTTRPHIFDDKRELGAVLWTIYATRKSPNGTALDLYYIGDRRENRTYSSARGRELRHSVGVRWSSAPGAWQLDAEAVYQFGRVDGASRRDIRAWTIYASASHQWKNISGVPKLGIEMGIASGDGHPDDHVLGTFRAPQPPGRYFGNANPLGPSNMGGVTFSGEVSLSQATSLNAAARLFWRVSSRDGIYNPPGLLLRPANQSTAHFVGFEPTITLQHRFDRHLEVEGSVARFFAGRFLRETPPGRDVALGEVILTYRF